MAGGGISKAIAKAIFKSLAPDLLRPIAMINIARTQGGSYRRQDMLSDIRRYTQRSKYETQIAALSRNTPVPQAWMGQADLGGQASYRVYGVGTYYDEEIGGYYEKHTSFYTNDHTRPDVFEEQFMEYQPLTETEPASRMVSWKQTYQVHDPNTPF